MRAIAAGAMWPLVRMTSDTIGYTPVAIKYCVNEATIHAHFDNRAAINYWDFTRARESVEFVQGALTRYWRF